MLDPSDIAFAFEERLVDIAYAAMSTVLRVYKHKPRAGAELEHLKRLEEVVQRLEVLKMAPRPPYTELGY